LFPKVATGRSQPRCRPAAIKGDPLGKMTVLRHHNQMASFSTLFLRWFALAGATLLLTGCVTDGQSPFSFLTVSPRSVTKDGSSRPPTEVAAAQGDINSDEENDEEEEGNDPLDGWLQAYLYRSPDYQLTLPQRRNRLSEALKTAFDLRGTPYRLGGSTEQGLDCSGLVWVSFASAGIRLPRTSQEQFHATERVSRDALQPGDLVFFKTGRSKKREIDHVGIYVGNGKFLHAPRRGKVVSLASLSESYWDSRYRGAGRVPGSGAGGEASEPLETAHLALATSDDEPPSPRLNVTPEPADRPAAFARAASSTGTARPAPSKIATRTAAPSSRQAIASAPTPSRKGGTTVVVAKPSALPKPGATPRTATLTSAGTGNPAAAKANGPSQTSRPSAAAAASATKPASRLTVTATSSKSKPVASKPSSPAPATPKKEQEAKRIAAHP